MGKIIRLTETDLHNMIKESVERILKESDSGIHIKPENKGKFTATKKATGKSTEELTHSKNPLTRKRANFAKMAKRHWKPLKESITNNDELIKEVLFNGCFFNVNNKEGYDIGVGYGGGNKKEFFYPYSESMEHSYCHVSVEEIVKVVDKLKDKGFEFKYDNDGYVFMKGERKPFKAFIPFKPNPIKKPGDNTNPNVNPVNYYSDRLFKNSKNGNLNLF